MTTRGLAFPALLGLHFLLFSLAELLFFGIDKQLARAERRRLSELNLALTALLGGSFGGFVGMLLFRHKTQHGLFKYGLPILVFVHIVLLAIVMSGAGPES